MAVSSASPDPYTGAVPLDTPTSSPLAADPYAGAVPVSAGIALSGTESRIPGQAAPLSAASPSGDAPLGGITPPAPVGTSLPSFLERAISAGAHGDAALGGSSSLLAQAYDEQLRNREKAFTKENTHADGTPLDINQSIHPYVAGQLSLGDPRDAENILNDSGLYSNVRSAADGSTYIVRKTNRDGSKVDVLATPYGVNPSNAGAVVAGGAVPTAIGAGKMAAGALVGNPEAALAARIGGAIAPAASDLVQGQPLSQAALDTALTAGPAALFEGLPAAARALASKPATPEIGTLVDAAKPAAERLGLQLPLSNSTGSRLVATADTTMAGKLASQAEQNTLQQGLAQAQQNLVGAPALGGAVPTAGDIAASMDPKLATASVGDQSVGQLVQGAIQKNRDALGSNLEQALKPVTDFADTAGAEVKTANLEALEGQLTQEYGENKDAFSPIFNQIRRVISGLNPPPVEAGEEELSGLLDARGRPLAVGGEPEEAAPLTVSQAVNGKRLLGENVEWNDLGKNSDAIKQRVYGAFNQDIKDALGSIPEEQQATFAQSNGGLSPADAYEASNAEYSQGVAPFENARISAALRDPATGGPITPSRIVPSIFNGTGNIDSLLAYREALGGADSTEYQALKQQGINNLFNSSDLSSRLDTLAPEVKAELFGGNVSDVENYAKLAKNAEQGGNIKTVADVFPKLSPQLQEAVGQRTAQDIVDRARVQKPGTIQTTNDLNPSKLADIVAGPDAAKYAAVLGPQRVQQIKDLIAVSQAQGATAALAPTTTINPLTAGLKTGLTVAGAHMLGASPSLTAAAGTVAALSSIRPTASVLAAARNLAPGFNAYLRSGVLPPLAAGASQLTPAALQAALMASRNPPPLAAPQP